VADDVGVHFQLKIPISVVAWLTHGRNLPLLLHTREDCRDRFLA
jgi:hypothetical protein